MAGRLVAGEGSRVFDGAALDSRRVEPAQLFFALEGERTDGHRFVADAGRRGAAAAVVHREVELDAGEVDPGEHASGDTVRGMEPPEAGAETSAEDFGLIRVENTFGALHDLTRHVRRQVPERLVALTGSVGKTTTKELLAVLLARRYRVARNPGNLNNLYGFPLSLLNIADDTEWMVAEMGMSTPGELAEVSRLGRPDVALLTNVRPVHLEFFDSLRAIAEAKAELFEGLRAGGLVVANAGDPEVVRVVRRHRRRDSRARVAWFRLDTGDGESPSSVAAGVGIPQAQYRATDIESRSPAAGPGHRFRLHTPGGVGAVELPLYGVHNVENFLAAAAVAAELGVSLTDLVAAAAMVEPAAGRGVVHRLAGDVTVLDESYNSNPWALVRALEGAAGLSARRRWAVLGDMLELGAEALEFHRRAGREAVRYGFDPVVGVGELARELASSASEAGAEAPWFETAAEAAEWAAAELRDGDLVLVKGSRGVALEEVVDRLLARREREGGV